MASSTPEREQDLFHACLELTPPERSSYLERTCAGDLGLQERIERLLAAHRRAEQATLNPLRDFLAESPKPEYGSTTTGGEGGGATRRVGDAVGLYCLVRLLAEGGMGSVWLAERGDGLLNRPVALKLPRGAWRGARLAERMAREREILAALNHPNIARLYDAGLTSDGQPYLALEYVEGRRIDEYCRERRLELGARLRLFVQVANAVAHAHAKLVVHRDLKPANILVTEDGQARLLDFGIAKLLQEGEAQESELTQLSGRPFTPDYASPEQIAGEPITIGSDVYSLGVTLYELLTEARPYELKRDSRGALEEAILQADPVKPSDVAAQPSWRKTLRGDLDTIVLKALKKKPEERYATVNAFVEDIERYLQGRPVVAQPDSRWYRLRKFVARNRLVVGGAAVALFAVLVGAGVAVWQARVALAEKARAEEVKEFIASIFREADPYEGKGKALSANDLLKQAKDRIDRLSTTRPELRVELLNLVGSSLMSLGDTDAAESVARQVVDEARRGLGPEHLQTVQARLLLTDVYRYRGQVTEMRQELKELLPVVRRRERSQPEDLIRTLENQAHMAIDDGEQDEAIAAAQEAFDLALRRLGERHPRTVAAATILAESLSYNRTPDEVTLAASERALRLARNAHPENPRHPSLIYMHDVHGRNLGDVGQMHRAIEEMDQALRDASEVFGPSSQMVGFLAGNIAPIQRWVGDIRTSLENSNRSISILEKHAQSESFTYAIQYTTRGVTWLAARRGAEALKDLATSKEILGRVLGPSHWETLTAQFNGAIALAYLGRIDEAQRELQLVRDRSPDVANLTWSLYALGTVDRFAGDYEAALREQQEGLGMITGSRAKWNRARALLEIGLDQLELGRYDDAIASLEEVRALFLELETRMHPAQAEVLVGLGRAYVRQGQAARALPLLEEADAFWRDFDPDNRWAGEATLWLGRCYAALGRRADARQSLARAEKVLSRSPIPGDSRLAKLARVI